MCFRFMSIPELKLKINDFGLSRERGAWILFWVALFLGLLLSFGIGYLMGGYGDRAPIVIEQCSAEAAE